MPKMRITKYGETHKSRKPSQRRYATYWELHANLVKCGEIKKSSRPKYLRMVFMFDAVIQNAESRAYGFTASLPAIYYIKKYGTYYNY